MIAQDVKLIEYSRKVDFLNCITHAAGAVFSVIGIAAMIIGFKESNIIFNRIHILPIHQSYLSPYPLKTFSSHTLNGSRQAPFF